MRFVPEKGLSTVPARTVGVGACVRWSGLVDVE